MHSRKVKEKEREQLYRVQFASLSIFILSCFIVLLAATDFFSRPLSDFINITNLDKNLLAHC